MNKKEDILPIETLVIIGVGLIGGSLALSLRRLGFARNFIGVESNELNAEKAIKLGLVDKVLPLEEAVKRADMVILSTPIDYSRKILPDILDLLQPNALMVDMGSTKNGICTAWHNHPKRRQYVASHPIAGTEYSGPTAAIDYLFEGKKTIICEAELSADWALNKVELMYNLLGMEIIHMSAEMHDKHIAFVSHLSHISSFALGLAVLDIEKNEKRIFDMAGSGFSSTVRLAKSSPATWAPIIIQNADSILFALDNYIDQLEQFKACIMSRDKQGLHQLIENANSIQRIIK